jgi:hypothetical protein
MIKLKAGTILVRDGDTTSPIDLDDLGDSLQRSCRAAGFDDPALANDVMQIIGHHLQSASCDVMTAFAIESLVCRILCDAGLRSVARQFRGVLADGPDDATVAAQPEAIADVLQADPYFAGLPTDMLSRHVAEAARLIGLERMTYACYVEIAKSIWLQQERDDEAECSFVLSAEETIAFAAEAIGEASARATVWSGVSSLVPVITVRCSLDGLFGDESVTELELLPAFDTLCADVLAGCRAIRLETARRLEERAPDTIRAAVLIELSGGMVRQKLKLSTKGLYSLSRDIESICRHHFSGISWIRADVI